MQQQSSPPKGIIIDIDQYQIHILSYGDVANPAVVFLHGSGPGASAYSNFKQNIDTVVSAGYRALLIDMLGFGYSSKPADCDYTTQLFASTVLAVLDKLDVSRVVMIGNSLGGAVCIRIALDYPQRVSQLVLMAPGGIETRETYFAMPGMTKMVNSFVGGELDKNGLRSILKILVFDKNQVTDELVEERYAILQTQPKEVLSRMIIPSMEHELANIKCPILGFWGQQDEMTPASGAQKFLQQCSQCQFLMMTDCGHWVMVEHSEWFNSQLFLVLNQLNPNYALETSHIQK